MVRQAKLNLSPMALIQVDMALVLQTLYTHYLWLYVMELAIPSGALVLHGQTGCFVLRRRYVYTYMHTFLSVEFSSFFLVLRLCLIL